MSAIEELFPHLLSSDLSTDDLTRMIAAASDTLSRLEAVAEAARALRAAELSEPLLLDEPDSDECAQWEDECIRCESSLDAALRALDGGEA